MTLIPYDPATNTLIKSLNYDSDGNLVDTPSYVDVDDILWSTLSSKYSIDDFCVIDNKIAVSKEALAAECNNISSKVINEAYPLYKQINLTNDSTRSVSVISIQMSKTTQDVYGEMFSLVQNLNSVDELKSYKSTIDSIDFTSLVASAPESNRPGLIQAYKTILQSIIAQELIRSVRSWYNAKIEVINSCSTAEELNAISFEDCPDIS